MPISFWETCLKYSRTLMNSWWLFSAQYFDWIKNCCLCWHSGFDTALIDLRDCRDLGCNGNCSNVDTTYICIALNVDTTYINIALNVNTTYINIELNVDTTHIIISLNVDTTYIIIALTV